ncbi:MAG: hypothetical protein GX155_09735 [Smithella sp.]|jgi:YHS domain-containing protein|nr:hypothetical protein [Smithella sp.]
MIVKIAALLVLLYIAYKVLVIFRRMKSADATAYRANSTPSQGEDLVQDPFCKTYVPKSQAYVRQIEGHNTYFCTLECCEKYLEVKNKSH